MKKFYITTPVYYVNAKPHLGHAYTTIAADVLARFHKLQGEEVFFLVGTDEHGLKIQKEAEKAGKEPQIFADEIAEEFKILWKKLNIKYDNFIRTTDDKHKEAVQEVLQTLYESGAICKGSYEGLYCVGCEQFLNESDLKDGKCPDHNAIPEKVKEESYLLKMTEVQDKLIEKIEKDDFKITPEKYKKEILSFLKNQELRNVSISRKNVKWGIPLPFDSEHTSYVWFDAFLNYLTGLGWDGDEKNIPEMWPPEVQLIGKDILRVHATIWPAILMHLNIPLPKLLFTHGHIISGGKKMSKTLGNTISVDEMIEKFGVDATRYLLLSAGTFGEDVDMTMERMTEKYNADLANGIGNLTSRIVTLYSKSDKIFSIDDYYAEGKRMFNDFEMELNNCNFGTVLDIIVANSRNLDRGLANEKPWEIFKKDKAEFDRALELYIKNICWIAADLEIFMPEISKKIKKALEDKKTEILFPRIK
jgi:methionyl-tRNA synthetase